MGNEANWEESLRLRLSGERNLRMSESDDEVWKSILAGDHVRARTNLLFFSKPGGFAGRVAFLIEKIETAFSAAAEGKERMLRFALLFGIDLSSAATEWVLRKTVPDAALAHAGESVLTLLRGLCEKDPDAERKLLAELRIETNARVSAEGVGAEDERQKLVLHYAGKSLAEYAGVVIAEVRGSNLTEAAVANIDGSSETEIGNDYADFLQFVVWRGGSFATTNPLLIKFAYDIDNERWNGEIDREIRALFPVGGIPGILAEGGARLGEAIDRIVANLTIAVVMRNCLLLRPIFLHTQGSRGYVSLQINPRNHDDSESMIREARAIYEELERRLGGVPNVVIKLPATSASLRAAESLTLSGIGVNLTLTFSMYQALPFAKILSGGHCLNSFISIMNGRLAFPVRDELKARNVPQGVEAARLAGVEIARKAFRRIYGKPSDGGLGLDPSRVRILIASLRIYDAWIPDISELWGIPLITVFPNVRRSFETIGSRERNSVKAETPRQVVETLLESEIFRQAWWTEADGKHGKPARELSLAPADSAAVADWVPIRETLSQFIGAYAQMCEIAGKRMEHVAVG